VRRNSLLGTAAVLLTVAARLPAQDPAADDAVLRARVQAVDLERQGRFAEAAAWYIRGLDVQPANTTLLMGLERMLARVGRLEEALPYFERAMLAAPRDEPIRELQFRLAARAGGVDSASAAAARWMAALPESETPYREWSRWLAQRGESEAALAVLEQGRALFGDAALAEHTAPVLTQAGRWVEAAEQWALAVARNRSLLSPAGASVGRAPPGSRDAVVQLLLELDDPAATWLASDLLLQWDRAEQAWVLLDGALPGPRPERVRLLRRFADRAGQRGTREAMAARGFALERLAQLVDGAAVERARLQAAQAFADAGNLNAAQRMLSQVSLDAAETAGAADAMVTFIRVLAESGQVGEAQRHFERWEERLPPGEIVALREALAWGWIAAGDLDQAEVAIGADSSVGALALHGWIAAYRGDLVTAREQLAAAGPYARPRAESTRSAALLVLLERVRAERLEELGRALVSLSVGDTLGAVEELRSAAERLPAGGGRADVLTFAGELAAAAGYGARAERLLLDALDADSAGPTAPAAELLLAAVYAEAGRNEEALARLEHVILTYPRSAVVPQARRLLDHVRGMIPRT
jgi:tetratricopeptide (TPR) repeat protein